MACMVGGWRSSSGAGPSWVSGDDVAWALLESVGEFHRIVNDFFELRSGEEQ